MPLHISFHNKVLESLQITRDTGIFCGRKSGILATPPCIVHTHTPAAFQRVFTGKSTSMTKVDSLVAGRDAPSLLSQKGLSAYHHAKANYIKAQYPLDSLLLFGSEACPLPVTSLLPVTISAGNVTVAALLA